MSKSYNRDNDPNSNILAGKLVSNVLQNYSRSQEIPDYKEILSYPSQNQHFSITFKRFLQTLEDIDRNIIFLNNTANINQKHAINSSMNALLTPSKQPQTSEIYSDEPDTVKLSNAEYQKLREKEDRLRVKEEKEAYKKMEEKRKREEKKGKKNASSSSASAVYTDIEGAGFMRGGDMTSFQSIDPYKISQLIFLITQQLKNADLVFETDIQKNLQFLNSVEKDKLRKIRDDLNKHFDQLFVNNAELSAGDFIYEMVDNGKEIFEVMREAFEILQDDISVFMANTPQIISTSRK